MPRHLVEIVNDHCLHRTGALPDLVDFDLTFKRPMIHDVVDGREGGAMRALADVARRKLPRLARNGS
jgi:hypothetical protein